jgi:hypothetical protein
MKRSSRLSLAGSATATDAPTASACFGAIARAGAGSV